MALHAHDDYGDRDGDIKIDTSFSSTSTSENAHVAANANAAAADMEGAEASAAAAAVAMAAAERIFGDDEEDIEDSSDSNIAVSKERGGSGGGVSMKGGLGTPPKREKVFVGVVFPEEAGGGMKGGLGDGLCKGLRWYHFISCLVCMVARVACFWHYATVKL